MQDLEDATSRFQPPWVKYPRDDDLHSMLQGSAGIIDGDEKWGHPAVPARRLGRGNRGGTGAALQAAGSNSSSEPPPPPSSPSRLTGEPPGLWPRAVSAMAQSHWSLLPVPNSSRRTGGGLGEEGRAG